MSIWDVDDSAALLLDHGAVGVWHGSQASAATPVQALTASRTVHMYRMTCVGGAAAVGGVHAFTDCHSGVLFEWCCAAML